MKQIQDKDIPSVKVIEALDKVLEISEKLGFRTFKDPEGYYGYSEIGSGDELFGILSYGRCSSRGRK